MSIPSSGVLREFIFRRWRKASLITFPPLKSECDILCVCEELKTLQWNSPEEETLGMRDMTICHSESSVVETRSGELKPAVGIIWWQIASINLNNKPKNLFKFSVTATGNNSELLQLNSSHLRSLLSSVENKRGESKINCNKSDSRGPERKWVLSF